MTLHRNSKINLLFMWQQQVDSAKFCVVTDFSKGGLSLLVPHWRYLAVFGGVWRYLAVFGGIWRYLAVFGGIWRYLAVFGGIWRYLAVFGICVFYASCQPSGCIRSAVYQHNSHK